jgi:hypothetical protein
LVPPDTDRAGALAARVRVEGGFGKGGFAEEGFAAGCVASSAPRPTCLCPGNARSSSIPAASMISATCSIVKCALTGGGSSSSSPEARSLSVIFGASWKTCA